MEIKHSETGRKGRFSVEDDGAHVGEIDYFRSAPGEITIYHTGVDEKFRGEGLGRDLVDAVVKYAREKGLKIVPKCHFAKKIMEETPEMHDVLAG